MPTREKPFGITVGTDIKTGEPVIWRQSDLRYGAYLTVAARGGKTALMSRAIGELVTRGSPAIIIDDAGTFWDELQRRVAWAAHTTNAQLIDLTFGADERRAILRRKFLKRYSFAFLGHGQKNHVRLDILKRRQLPGRRESIEEVVSGSMRPFEARFKDIEIRTKFVSVVKPSLAALIAAERPITEIFPLLLDPRYWYFLRAEIIRLKVLDDPESYTYLVPQMQHLRRILDLRKTKGGTIECEPYPQVYRDKIDSTIHAMEVYTPGTRASEMFTEDTFSPESVVFGDGVFALTSDVGSELGRNLAIANVYTAFERLMKYRLASFGNSKNRLFLVFDELRWFYEGITRFFSTVGNHRVSVFAMNQQDEQWDQLGMPALAKILPKLLSGLRIRDAAASRETADEMALRDALYDPFGLQHRLSTVTRTQTESETESDTESEGEGESESTGWQSGGSSQHGKTQSDGTSLGNGLSFRQETKLDPIYSNDEGMTHGAGTSEGSTNSWGDSGSSARTKSRGFAATRGSGRSTGESTIEHVLNAGAAEQHLLRLQQMFRLPRFVVQMASPDRMRYVQLAAPTAPCADGTLRRIVAEFQEGSAALHASRRSPRRRAYDPSITLAPAAPPSSASAPVSPPPEASTCEDTAPREDAGAQSGDGKPADRPSPPQPSERTKPSFARSRAPKRAAQPQRRR